MNCGRSTDDPVLSYRIFVTEGRKLLVGKSLALSIDRGGFPFGCEGRSVLTALRKKLETERVRLNDGSTPYPFTNQQGLDFWETYKATRP